jgi:hypothetical protein
VSFGRPLYEPEDELPAGDKPAVVGHLPSEGNRVTAWFHEVMARANRAPPLVAWSAMPRTIVLASGSWKDNGRLPFCDACAPGEVANVDSDEALDAVLEVRVRPGRTMRTKTPCRRPRPIQFALPCVGSCG